MNLTAFLIDGMLIGFVYGIAAMGLSLIWGVMDVINLAHGPIIALGMFGIYLAVDPARALEATDLVLNEIGKLCAEPVTATELQGAVEYTKGNLLLASESNDNQMVRSAQNEIHFNRIIRLPEIIKNILLQPALALGRIDVGGTQQVANTGVI